MSEESAAVADDDGDFGNFDNAVEEDDGFGNFDKPAQ